MLFAQTRAELVKLYLCCQTMFDFGRAAYSNPNLYLFYRIKDAKTLFKEKSTTRQLKQDEANKTKHIFHAPFESIQPTPTLPHI